MGVKVSKIQPSYKKDNGMWLIALDEIPLPEGFDVKDQSVIYFPARQVGGNHKHPRSELFVGIGEGLEIIWLDEKEQKHSEKMNPNGKLQTCFVTSLTPHAIVNKSDSPAYIIELANAKQSREDVERVEIEILT